MSASVEAIEPRDPTTSGHSRRVADSRWASPRPSSASRRGPYREASFTREDLRELEYASLLHDFGKIGVREQVLVKAKKLYDAGARAHPQRFEFAVRSLEVEILTRKLRALRAKRTGARDLEALDLELESGAPSCSTRGERDRERQRADGA